MTFFLLGKWEKEREWGLRAGQEAEKEIDIREDYLRLSV